MLRPERMSKVSVTGSKPVMETVIETLYDLSLVHLERYDDAWEAFEPGTPFPEAESISEKLVTVRAIESILDLEEMEGVPRPAIPEDVEQEIERTRREVNDLDDRRSDLRDEIREVEDELERMRPFADLGIDLDLLWGYEAIEVAVVEGREEEIVDAVDGAATVEAYETFTADGTVAIFARPAAGEAGGDGIKDALVGVDAAELEVPRAEGDPSAYVEELEHRRQQLEARVRSVDNELESLKLEAAGFLLAVEEDLTVAVEKAEAPLRFATTERSFIAEGWVPSSRYPELEATLRDRLGERVDVEELEQVAYEAAVTGHGHGDEHEAGEADAATDGGRVVSMHKREPPVVQDNPGPIRPFQVLVEAINRPRYYEIDPTVILFLTFPTLFGLMIGDVGYGLLYLGIGAFMYRRFESPGLKSLGGVAIWCGIFTAFFGFLYGEVLGFHTIAEYFWHPVVGLEGAPIEKGLDSDFALFWLVVALLVGIFHLSVGYVFGFLNELERHDVVTAAAGNLSWVLLMGGVWLWIFSRHVSDMKPAFLYSVLDGEPVALGFAGFSPETGLVGLAVAGVGFVGMLYGEYLHEGGIGIAIGLLESLSGALVNVVSYARVTAVLLAKAGMAFVVNLLTFGAYRDDGGHFHFLDAATSSAPDGGELMFGGIITTDAGLVVAAVTIVVGAVIFLFGHLIVLGLGITSAGLQGVRLEYVEFFGKFYDGGGDKYEPFGHDRNGTRT